MNDEARSMKRCALFLTAILVSGVTVSAQDQSSYAGLERREIKSLSKEKIRDYLEGRGMGLALPAELNRYPGPKHVLEMANQLELTDDQKRETELVYEKMERDAKRLGKSIVDWEAALDGLFSSKTVTEDQLAMTLDGLAELEARLRYTHLAAHLRMKQLLTDKQIDRYVELRGYSGARDQHSGHSGQH